MNVMKTHLQEKVDEIRSEKINHVIFKNMEYGEIDSENQTGKRQNPDLNIYAEYLQRYCH